MNAFRTAALFRGTVGLMFVLAAAATAGAETGDSEEVAKARERIAEVAKEMLKNAETVRKDLTDEVVAEEDIPLDLMRYATYRVAGAFFSTWSADKKLVRPDKPRCFIEDSAPETTLAMQLANDEFLMSFVQEGHLLEVTSGIADEICKTFAPQIIRPMVKQADASIPPDVASPPPAAKKDDKKKKTK